MATISGIFCFFLLDINECVRGMLNCDSNADCVNTEGSFRCMCRAGYEGNGQICTGTNMIVYHILCHFLCVQKCVSHVHTYISVLHVCKLSLETLYYADIDECIQGLDDCPANMFCRTDSSGGNVVCGASDKCVNTEGSFQCMCTSGFSGDGQTCTGVYKQQQQCMIKWEVIPPSPKLVEVTCSSSSTVL